MINIRLFLFVSLFSLCQSCDETPTAPTKPLNVESLPANAERITNYVVITNSWVEQDKFNVVGICTNMSAEWQKIWLEFVPLTDKGKPVTISNCTSVIVPTFSDAVPPTGRTSFFASWPLSTFKGKPDSCSLKAVLVTHPAPGPILVATMTNGMKMLGPSSSGQLTNTEMGWQVSSSISNPLPMVASRPRLEILVYGEDNRLWLSTVLNPEDPAVQSFYHSDGAGPLQPGENRPFSLGVYYQGLPKPLQEKKIGNVVILPFEARQ